MMTRISPTRAATASLALLVLAVGAVPQAQAQGAGTPAPIKLPVPREKSEVSVEQALRTRHFLHLPATAPLTLAEIGQLLWAAQGVVGDHGRRTVPSAGTLHPLEIVLVAGSVEGLRPGVYRYRPEGHELVQTVEGDRRQLIETACQFREYQEVPAIVLVMGVEARVAAMLEAKAPRFVALQAGAAAQNLVLQANALGLGCGLMAGFSDPKASLILGTSAAEQVLAALTVGRE